jgi:hypothetical protein
MSPDPESRFHPSPDSDWVMLQQFMLNKANEAVGSFFPESKVNPSGVT